MQNWLNLMGAKPYDINRVTESIFEVATQSALCADAIKKKCKRLGIEVVVNTPTQLTTTTHLSN